MGHQLRHNGVRPILGDYREGQNLASGVIPQMWYAPAITKALTKQSIALGARGFVVNAYQSIVRQTLDRHWSSVWYV